MKTPEQKAAPTFESVWALLQENAQQMKENERILNEKFAETDRQIRETDRQMKETDRFLKEKFAETDRQMKETQAYLKQRMKETDKIMGVWANNHGSFAEEYFFNSFENGKRDFFGERFDVIEKNVKGFKDGLKDEYDIVMYNGTSVAIIEVKFKAHEEYLPQVLKKAHTFKILYPYYNDYTIYLGMASMSFQQGAEEKYIKQGIAVIKQVGDTVVVNETNLKTF